jgi:MoxR-like ATPase
MTKPAQDLEARLEEGLGRVLFGMESTIHGLCLALVAKGQVLVEGVPGLGKTLLAKTLARQLRGRFKRIQCTADMMPSDMTGIHVYNSERRAFDLLPGPLFADVVLVDEINRTGPKTQSALLQAMEEGCITIDRDTYALPADYFIIASQNPHELEGTYPLPESQLDRFLLRLTIGYPDPDEEQQVLRAYDHPGGGHAEAEKAVEALPEGLVDEARAQAAQVVVSDAVYSYVVAIAAASRSHSAVSLGLSTRGALALMRCARVEAALRSSDYVTPDHVKAVARAVVAHRLILTPEAMLEGMDGDSLTNVILGQVPVPRDSA